ncbi:MAG: enoyl-CoA hydratase/isomerase family protein [Pseudomonadota bacterium]
MSLPIRLETRTPLAELILDRPEKRNALTHEMWSAIPDLIARAEADEAVKVVIVHGGSAGAFAAGQDIREFETQYATREGAAEAGIAIAAALRSVEMCEKPVMAAIDGACVGGGMSLALACDLRIASPGAKFAITPAKLGLVYPPADMALLLKQVSPSVAKRVLFTADLFSADQAVDLGLIDEVAGGSALNAAEALAAKICAVSQWSTRAIKQMISGIHSGWSHDTREAVEMFLQGFENADHEEGYRAFLDKRKPDFPIN